MSYSIVINSLTGNTKLLADSIKSYLKDENCIYFGNNSSEALKADLIFIGFWTNQGTCDEKTKEFIKMLTKENVFLFGTAGFASSAYFDEIINNVTSILPKDVKLCGSFMCQGKMQQKVKDRYLAMKNNPDLASKADYLIANFDKALSHPNKDDINALLAKISGVDIKNGKN